MKSVFHKTLALTLSVSMLAAYTPGFATERQVIEAGNSAAFTGDVFENLSVNDYGGAIHNAGTVTVSDVAFTGNKTTTRQGSSIPTWTKGGAVYNTGSFTLSGTNTFENNQAAMFGGAIGNEGGTVSITGGATKFNGNKTGASTSGGAIANFSGGTVNISDDAIVSFENNAATYSGGAIYQLGEKLTDGTVYYNDTYLNTGSNTTFRNNTAQHGGAIAYEGSGIININGSTFDSNHATDDHGGAIITLKYSTLTLNLEEGTTFKNNTATQSGGAIMHGNSAKLNANGVIFNDNTAGNFGGAIAGAVSTTSVIDIKNSSFEGNTAGLGGGAIDAYAQKISINGSDFTGNKVTNGTTYGGGAILVEASTTIDDSTFTENVSNVKGGAIHNTDALTVTNSTFTDNTASEQGGAIYNEGALTFDGTTTFVGNEATDEDYSTGGAIYNAITENGNANITFNGKAIFDGNKSGFAGGALYADEGSVTFKDTVEFSNNTATNLGGAINWYSTNTDDDGEYIDSLTFEKSATFKNNSAGDTSGGAIQNDGGKIVFQDGATFEGNKAGGNGLGGAIYNAAEMHIAGNAEFTKNSAVSGGAIYNGADDETILSLSDSSSFVGNSAEQGGAIYNENDAQMFINNATFTDNTATENGGAIFNGGTLTLAGTNTFSGNTAAEGADIYNAGALTINDTTTLDGGIAGDGTVNVNGTLNIGQAEVKAGTIAFANGSTVGVEFGNDNMGNLKANTITVGENAADTAKLQVVLSKDFLTTDKTEHSLTNGTDVTNGKFALADVTNALYNVSFDDATNIVTAQRKSQEEQQDAINEAGGTSNDTTVLAAYTSASDFGNETTNKVADLINTLAQTDTAKLVEVTKAVAPEVAPAKQVVHTAVLNEVFGALQHRMADASAASPAMYALGDAKDYNTANTKHFSVWTQGLLNKSHKEATSDAHAFTGRSTGVAAGADMKVGESGLVGLGYAYTHTNVSSTGRHDRILGDNFFLYGQYRPSAFYVQGSLAYGDSKYEESKYLPGMTLDADYHVQHYAMQGRVGYDVTDWFSPNMGLRYTRLHQEGYTDGAQNVSADNANYFTGMLGADFQTEQRLSQHVSLLPHLYTGLSYDFKSDDNNSRVTLPNATGYNVTGERLHRLAFEVGAGVTARLYHSVEMALGYEGSFRQDYNSHTGTLKLRYLF